MSEIKKLLSGRKTRNFSISDEERARRSAAMRARNEEYRRKKEAGEVLEKRKGRPRNEDRPKVKPKYVRGKERERITEVVKKMNAERDRELAMTDPLVQKMIEWKRDWVLAVEELIGVEPTAQQAEGLRVLGEMVIGTGRVANGKAAGEGREEYPGKLGLNIMSGRGTGKDAFAAWCILLFLFLFERAKVPCTAPTGHQLNDVLWAECAKWLAHSKDKHREMARANGVSESEIMSGRYDGLLSNTLVWQSEKIYHRERGGQEWFAVARTCNTKGTEKEQAETLSGFHEDFMLIVIDEASGVPDAAFRPLETTLTGACNLILAIYNPTRSTGFAVEGQFGDRGRWVSLRWNAEDSTITSKAQIQELEKKYGRDSNPYRIHVLGLPPRADTDTLIPWDWIQDAVERGLEVLEDDPVLLGVDVGAGGDKSVITVYQGGKQLEMVRHNTKDTMELVGWVVQKSEEYGAKGIFVDVIGVGNGVYSRLKELGVRVHAVDVRRTPRDDQRFSRLRDELWWKLREDFEKGTISIVRDQELIDQLGSIKYKPDSAGRIKIESKEEMRRRGMSSPDEADSLMLIKHLGAALFRSKKQKADDYDDDEKYRRRLGRLGRWAPEENWMVA